MTNHYCIDFIYRLLSNFELQFNCVEVIVPPYLKFGRIFVHFSGIFAPSHG